MRLKSLIKLYALPAAQIFSMVFQSCGGKPSNTEVGDALVSVNDSVLKIQDVERKIPSGLSETDSAELFSEIVERWIESNVLEEVARENVIDLERIDKMAEEYRNRLIVDEYIRRMDDSRNVHVEEKEIKAYYEGHKKDLVLTAPLIKGIYIKTSENAPELANLRRWMMTATDSSVDNIEKFGMHQASQYEYFGDRWVDFSAVADQIPYRFYDADAFLKTTVDFETEYEGSVYLLHISDYLPSGSEMPYQYAAGLISETLSGEKRRFFRENLKKSIYKKAIKDGVLKGGLYDPVTGNMKTKEE